MTAPTPSGHGGQIAEAEAMRKSDVFLTGGVSVAVNSAPQAPGADQCSHGPISSGAITPKELAAFYAYDPATGEIVRKKNGKRAFASAKSRGYFHGRHGTSFLSAHRVAWAIHYGRWPSGVIDHINGVTSDNRIENLRDVSQEENIRAHHRSAPLRCGYVYRHRSSWVAMKPKSMPGSRYVGQFKCFGAAIKAAYEARNV